jgi:molybdopterin converting factor small subunit
VRILALGCLTAWDKIMRVEFFGLPRERAGVAEIEVQVDTLGQLFGVLAAQFPSLADFIGVDQLSASLVANLNGDEFVRDPARRLGKHDRVLILSADAGG